MTYLLFSLLAIPANRIRGMGGYSGLGRAMMALLVTLPLLGVQAPLMVCASVIGLSYLGVSTAHGKYFPLAYIDQWAKMALTGLVYTAPAAVVLGFAGHPFPALALVIAGLCKPLAYYVGRRSMPGKDFIERAEYLNGVIIALGLMPAYALIGAA